MKKEEGPYRTCVGCRQRKPKGELLRLVGDSHLKLVIDLEQKHSGRGTYLCKNVGCAQKALKRKAISYALRRQVTVPPDFLKAFPDYLQPI